MPSLLWVSLLSAEPPLPHPHPSPPLPPHPPTRIQLLLTSRPKSPHSLSPKNSPKPSAPKPSPEPPLTRPPTVYPSSAVTRAVVGGASGLALFDSEKGLRLMADTLDRNATGFALLDEQGRERTRLSAEGDLRTFDKDGLSRLMIGSEGSVSPVKGNQSRSGSARLHK